MGGRIREAAWLAVTPPRLGLKKGDYMVQDSNNYTPGPWEWRVVSNMFGTAIFRVGYGDAIAWLDGNGGPANIEDPTHLANCRLIAAAPDMHERLRDALYCLHHPDDQERHNHIRKAIQTLLEAIHG